MTRFLGFKVEIALTDDAGRRLYVDAFLLNPQGLLSVNQEKVARAIDEATAAMKFDQPLPVRPIWRVES